MAGKCEKIVLQDCTLRFDERPESENVRRKSIWIYWNNAGFGTKMMNTRRL